MKTIISVALAAALAMGLGTTAFAEVGGTITRAAPISEVVTAEPALNAPLAIYGQITEITEGKVHVKQHSNDTSVILNITDKTWLIDAVSGKKLENDLKVGDSVAAFYGPATTRSIPPMSNAVAIISNAPADFGLPRYAVVEAVEKTEGGIRVTTDNGGRVIALSAETEVASHLTGEAAATDGIEVGSELVLWYNQITLSLPGFATAEKAVILGSEKSQAANKIIVSVQAGVISLNGKEIPLAGDTVYNKDGVVMLPLRVLAEALGYEVVWNADTSAIELRQGASSVTLRIGSTEYGVNKMRVVIETAPEITGEKTYVPSNLFESIDVEIVINNDNV